MGRGLAPATERPAVIEIQNVDYAYTRSAPLVLSDFSASLPAQAVTAITGDNGSGKTTLTRLMVGIARPLSGRVLVEGADIAPLSLAEIGRRVGYVYQNPSQQLFCTSVKEEMAYGLRNLGLDDDEISCRTNHYLSVFGLAGRADAFPLSLSHGEKQRLMLAVVLSMRPAFVVLDEPTTGLDIVRRRALGAHLRAIADDDGCGVVIVSHERGFVARYADGELAL